LRSVAAAAAADGSRVDGDGCSARPRDGVLGQRSVTLGIAFGRRRRR
jgi:hypothetical protein